MKNYLINIYNKIGLLFILVIVFSFSTSIYYQIAWGPSMTDSFPSVERMLDSSFITNDFYTNTFNDFSARYYISKFYILGGEIFSTHYTTFIAYSNIVRIFITIILVYFLFLLLIENKKAAFIGTFLGAFSFFLFPRTVGWGFLTADFSGQYIPLLFNILALILILKNKSVFSLILFSISVLFHPIVTLHGIFVGLVMFFSKYGWLGFKKILSDYKFYLFSVIFIGFTLMWYFPYLETTKGIVPLSASEFTYIIGYFRHPHHYIPSQFGLFGWVVFVGYLISLIYMVVLVRKTFPYFKLIINLLIYLFLLMIVGYIFVEIIPIKAVVTFIPYRSLWIFPLIYMCIYGLYLYNKFYNRDYLSFVFLHIPIMLFFISSNYPSLLKYKFTLISYIIVFLYAGINDFGNFKNKYINNVNIWLDTKIFKKNSLEKIYFLPIILFFVFSLYNFNILIPNINDNENIVYKWIQNNTFEQSVIVSEPNSSIDNSKIRLIARRAIIVNNDFPFVEKYYKEWYQRSTDVYGSNINNPSGHIDNMSEYDLKMLFDKYNANFLIRTKKIDNPKYFKEISKIINNNVFIILYEYKQ